MEQPEPLLQSKTDVSIPAWGDLRSKYASKWEEEKEKFYNQLRENFKQLINQWKSGKQEIYQLPETPYMGHYERAFRDLFPDTGYQATVGEMERNPTGTMKFKKLYVTLPDCFSSK